MNFKEGEYVMYAANEVCRYGGIVTKSFDGKKKVDYFKLEPVYSSNSAYYVPFERIDEKVRHLLSKDKLEAAINEASKEKTEWNEDKNKRRNEFSEILKSNDFKRIFIMLRSIYEEKIRLGESGKKLFVADERAFLEGERLIRQEFSIVLGKSENEVDEYIRECFSKKSQ